MFTGIVQGVGRVLSVWKKQGLYTIKVLLPTELQGGIELGASISLSGVCLTVIDVQREICFFDLVQETLDRSTLGVVGEGTELHVERAARFGDEIGGHLLSGHVDGMGKVYAVERPENNCILTVEAPLPLRKFIFEKGYIALDGTSLTLAKVSSDKALFSVCLIPETLRRTTLGKKVIGELINIEVDRQTQAVVETVERVLLGNEGLWKTPS